jgi:hypothetical protein
MDIFQLEFNLYCLALMNSNKINKYIYIYQDKNEEFSKASHKSVLAKLKEYILCTHYKKNLGLHANLSVFYIDPIHIILCII